VPSAIDDIDGLRERIQNVLTRLDTSTKSALREVGYERTLADQMLMRMGVMEWVGTPNQRFQWGGMGETNPEFHGSLFTPDHGQPSQPTNPDDERLTYYGFRLIWRAT
jgi:hypothetical protein